MCCRAAFAGEVIPRRLHFTPTSTCTQRQKKNRYPPTLDADLDGADAGLSTLKTQSLEGPSAEGDGEGQHDGEEPDEEEHRVLPSTKEERREAKKKLKDEEKKLKVRGVYREGKKNEETVGR